MASRSGSQPRQVTSRRGFLTNTARVTSAGVLALLALAQTSNDLASPVAAQDVTDDLAVLNLLLKLEQLEHALYRDGLERFTAERFQRERPASVHPTLTVIRDQERTHAVSLASGIAQRGGTPAVADNYDFGFEDIDGFLGIAAAVENMAVAAYTEVVPTITDRSLLAAATRVLAVEARHAAYLNARLSVSPFPEAFGDTATPAAVLAVMNLYAQGD